MTARASPIWHAPICWAWASRSMWRIWRSISPRTSRPSPPGKSSRWTAASPSPEPITHAITSGDNAMTEKAKTDAWTFVHHQASEAEWTPGLREIFDYRDLGIKEATKGDYVAHVIRANGRKSADKVQRWHMHDCTFQLVYVLNGWATFE